MGRASNPSRADSLRFIPRTQNQKQITEKAYLFEKSLNSPKESKQKNLNRKYFSDLK